MIAINSTELYLEQTGGAVPLLFVHGTGGGTFLFDRVTRSLTDFRCIAYDRRGNGRSASDASPNRGIEGDADDVAALIESLGIKPCILVGLSWGSAVVVDVLRRYPDVCMGAVLGEPTIFALDPTGADELLKAIQPAIAAAMQQGGPRSAVDAFYSMACGPFWETLSDDEREPYRNNARGMFRDFEAPPYGIREEDLRAIPTRCTLLVGDNALPFHRTVADVMRKALPHADCVEIPHSGHVVFGEQPQHCADVIRAFAVS